MYPIEETELAGIGRRFVVVTNSGSRLVIVVHESGTVELYSAAADDPQKTYPIATLTDEESRLIGAIIGRTIYRPEAIERLSKHGVVIRWHTLKENSYAIGKTVGGLFQNVGVVVLAIVEKGGKKQAGPHDDYVFQDGSQIALSGSIQDIEKIEGILDKRQ
ncbi:MAG: TrkA C-terminal domain-containing protein [Dehalococcoidales bacterium]|nr:TrkA C-terminal domain-containing protein [Dehalococcoidales bacterium]